MFAASGNSSTEAQATVGPSRSRPLSFSSQVVRSLLWGVPHGKPPIFSGHFRTRSLPRAKMSKKPSSREKAREDAIARFKQLLDEEEERRQSTEADSYAAQEAYWHRARGALFVNAGSSGQASFDAVMEAALNGGDTTKAWTTPIVLLPPISQQREVPNVTDDSSSPSGKRSRDDSDDQDEPKAKRSKKESKKGSKKESTSGKKAVIGTVPAPIERVMALAAQDVETLGYELANSTPAQVRKDLYEVASQAAASNREPYMIAYPWTGVRLWYDPSEYPDVYLAHWRFWNVLRPTFWRCALHPPLVPGAAQARYRKRKMRACQARLRFLSFCVETWGFVGFLNLLNATNTRLLWLGGRPGRHSPKARKGSVELDQCLGTLFFTDRARYKRRIAAALEPRTIDQEGYSSVVEFLEQSTALDADVDEAGRLSDGALARVRFDWVNDKRFRPRWKTEGLEAAYEKLRNHPEISTIDVEDQLESPAIPPFGDKEAEQEGFSPYKRKNGTFTALPPTSGGIVVYPTPASVAPNQSSKSGGNGPSSKSTKNSPAAKPKKNSPAARPKKGSRSAKVTNALLFGDDGGSSSDEEVDSEEDGEVDTEAREVEGGDASESEVPPQPDDAEEEKPPSPASSPPKTKTSPVRTRSTAKSA